MSGSAILAIDGPAVIFGGNYSNLEATRALLVAARQLGIAPRNIVCAGDVVGYCADPLATVQMVRRSGMSVVMGDNEGLLGYEAMPSANGGNLCFAADGAVIRNEEWYGFANRMLDEDAKAWMRALPRRLRLDIDGRSLAVIPSGLRRERCNIRTSIATQIRSNEIDLSDCDGVLNGYGGIPFIKIVNGRLWHNAGAIGLPANDGTPRTWYSTLQATHGKLRIELRALEYDFTAAARKMRQVGLSKNYALALQTGMWPSSAVTSKEEKAQCGRPLVPISVEW